MQFVAVAVLSFVVQNLANKEFSRRFACQTPGILLFDGIGLTITALIAACAGGAAVLSAQGLALAALFGALFVLVVMLSLRAFERGPFGMTALLCNMSMLIPALAGILVWGEAVTARKVAGMLCMLGVLLLSALGKGARRGADGRWLALTLSAALVNGTLGVIQKAFSIECAGESVSAFNFYGFGVGALLCWLLLAGYALARVPLGEWLGRPRALLATGVGFGLGSAGGNIFLMLALASLGAMIVYPLVQGTVIALVWLLSVFLYRERLTMAGLISIVLCIAGFIALS